MRILSIDFGLKRLGLAIGDTVINSASPLKPIILADKEVSWPQIKSLIDEYNIDKIIIGYPVNMDGTKSKTTLLVEKFTARLKNQVRREVEYMDERLTSFEADEMLKSFQGDYKKRKKIIDSISALIILKSYMEKIQQHD
jgi:putative Holliday junction resolvase